MQSETQIQGGLNVGYDTGDQRKMFPNRRMAKCVDTCTASFVGGNNWTTKNTYTSRPGVRHDRSDKPSARLGHFQDVARVYQALRCAMFVAGPNLRPRPGRNPVPEGDFQEARLWPKAI